MVYAAIDIHKRVFQAAVLDAETGELVQERLPATREALANWATRWAGKLEAVALEATTGWRWVWRELSSRGFEVRLCDHGSPGYWPRRCSRPVGFRRRTSSICATAPACAARSPRTGCASRSAYTFCYA